MPNGEVPSKTRKSVSAKRSSSKQGTAKTKVTTQGGTRATAKPDKIGATAKEMPAHAAARAGKDRPPTKRAAARGSASKTLQFAPKTVATKQDSFVSELNRASSTPATKGGATTELRVYAIQDGPVHF